MQKLFIKNRSGKRIALILDTVADQKGVVFIAHGRGGFKEQEHINAFSEAFKQAWYSTIRWDARNTVGESEGLMEDVTITSYYEDLVDVISWAKLQPWYQEPFILCGHSLGGIIAILYAEKFREKVKALAPISTVVSWSLSKETFDSKLLENWENVGYYNEESKSTPGLIRKMKWAYIADRTGYDVLKEASALIMPVLLIVGENDHSTPLEHQQILYEAIPHTKKELHIIKGAEHTFREKKHLEEIKDIILKFVKSID
ncbi:alpha/beta fold hydrolase [Candidatus Woesearchaeota archaeon]|nr:alpha/beta fold hydrolase [Candidatus Woesearchaeota archaeon]